MGFQLPIIPEVESFSLSLLCKSRDKNLLPERGAYFMSIFYRGLSMAEMARRDGEMAISNRMSKIIKRLRDNFCVYLICCSARLIRIPGLNRFPDRERERCLMHLLRNKWRFFHSAYSGLSGRYLRLFPRGRQPSILSLRNAHTG